jgi:hypothetical protein
MSKSLVVVFVALLAAAAVAHSVDPDEVVAYLNSAKVRDREGIERAGRAEKLPEVLIIEVGARWYAIDLQKRRTFARQWRDLWTHAVRKGRVSVIDGDTGAPVVRYGPRGSVDPI